MSAIDISDIEDRAGLLLALWRAQRPAAISCYTDEPSREACEQAVKRGYLDYFHGSAIKGSLNGDTFDAFLYDRDTPIKAQTTIDKFREAPAAPVKEEEQYPGVFRAAAGVTLCVAVWWILRRR